MPFHKLRDNSPILFMVTPFDLPYIHRVKALLKGRQAFVIDANPDIISEVNLWCKSKNIKYVISTNSVVLNLLVGSKKHQNIDNWAGSIYERDGITYLFVNNLKQFYSVPYGEFIIKRFISKIISPEEWNLTPEFTWEMAEPHTIERWFELFQKCLFIAVDIETISFEEPTEIPRSEPELLTCIRCICYTGIWEDGNIHTIVIPILEAEQAQQMFWIYWMRKFNLIKVTKVFQNGQYDNSHLICYGSPTWGYLWDTQSLFHSWYCELPKDLAFIAAFCVHNVYYWKDLADEGGKLKLFEYNARDGFATLLSFLYLLRAMPEWAWINYCIKFPVWVPCITCGLEGLDVNPERRATLITEYIQSFEDTRARLRKWFGSGFNATPKQVVTLFAFYGSGDLNSSDKYARETFASRHPLNARFAAELANLREDARILSAYLKPPNYSTSIRPSKRKSYLLKHGRLYYTFNPDGTDSVRFAGKPSFLWVGAQVQNWPAKLEEIRSMFVPPPGWKFFEIDAEQSEARDVAYLSGDKALIDVVESGKDYHALNAERFFGVPYDQIVLFVEGAWKVLNKNLRNLSKRTNHGSNYNMTWYMLLLTMGERAVDEAKKLLNLPPYWTRRQTCEYLLDTYNKAYPVVKGDYYKSIIEKVESTHMLVSPLGWTRYCFGHPRTNKEDHNACVAHPSQNLTAQRINEGFKEIFWKVVYPDRMQNIRLKAQVHDSIFGIYKIGREDIVGDAYKISVRPIEVVDCFGISRIMTVPMAAKTGFNWQEMESLKGLPNVEPKEPMRAYRIKRPLLPKPSGTLIQSDSSLYLP